MKGALLLWFLALVPLRAERPVWHPEKTWVFAVGVLNFDNPSLTTWPDEGRVDAVMLDAYRERGVPADRILFLKNEQATKAQITRKFAEFLQQAGADDTLVFYYAGHGGRNYNDAARPVHFVTYDTKANWSVDTILDTIERHFKGRQALLTVDCCHSGGLALAAAKQKGHVSYGVITSAQASAKSTGNWTFTQCLVDALRGKPQLDLDGDGQIDFQEVAKYCDLEMAFCENQRVSQQAIGGFPKNLALAERHGKAVPRVGERCEGEEKGKWWKVKILAAKDGMFQVTWSGWSKKYDSWLSADQLRPYQPKTLAAGTPVDIEWNKDWYPGKVVKSELGLLLVHYDGYPATDDEWMPMNRVKVKE
jgi:hypothetical protein